MDQAEYILLFANLLLGLGCGIPLARKLSRFGNGPPTAVFYGLLIVVYSLEALAFTAGMATNVPGIVLAVLWGFAFGHWARRVETAERRVLRMALLFSLYTALPAVSFALVPILMVFAGWSIVNVDDGLRFGIPQFVPWPVNTIMGFCIFVAGVAVLLKTIITTGEALLLFRWGGPSGRPALRAR